MPKTFQCTKLVCSHIYDFPLTIFWQRHYGDLHCIMHMHTYASFSSCLKALKNWTINPFVKYFIMAIAIHLSGCIGFLVMISIFHFVFTFSLISPAFQSLWNSTYPSFSTWDSLGIFICSLLVFCFKILDLLLLQFMDYLTFGQSLSAHSELENCFPCQLKIFYL